MTETRHGRPLLRVGAGITEDDGGRLCVDGASVPPGQYELAGRDGTPLGVLEVDDQNLPEGSVGRAAGLAATAQMAAERAENAGLIVRALILPFGVFPDGGEMYGYPILHAAVDRPGILT